MKLNLFTIIAKDNVDVNAKSSTASQHYHGTSMSIMQFPHPEHQVLQSVDFVASTKYTSKRVEKLPDSYATVGQIKVKPSIPFKSPIYLPVCTMNVSVPHSTIDSVLINAFKKELEWLKHNVELSDSCDSWSSYHSNKE